MRVTGTSIRVKFLKNCEQDNIIKNTMADICQPFLLCVITVESSAFKLLRDVWLTSILAVPEKSRKRMEFVEKKEKTKSYKIK